jgi:hypothetical protein
MDQAWPPAGGAGRLRKVHPGKMPFGIPIRYTPAYELWEIWQGFLTTYYQQISVPGGRSLLVGQGFGILLYSLTGSTSGKSVKSRGLKNPFLSGKGNCATALALCAAISVVPYRENRKKGIGCAYSQENYI